MSKLKKRLVKNLRPILKEMCSTPKKRDEIYEFNDDYTQEPKEPNNPEYMKGWEDGYEAAKIEVTMYGEGQDVERNPNIGLWEEWDDQLKGGLADKKKPEEFDQAQLEKGIKVEYEHTNDRNKAKEIAMDHLTEDPNYYKKLRKMESDKVNENNQKNVNPAVLNIYKRKQDILIKQYNKTRSEDVRYKVLNKLEQLRIDGWEGIAKQHNLPLYSDKWTGTGMGSYGDENLQESIKKSGSNYKVTNSSGNKTLGTHKTKKDALAQLRAIEISKKKRGK